MAIKDNTAIFLNIETLFNSDQERTVPFLQKVYSQADLLKRCISKITYGVLNSQLIITGEKILLKPNWVIDNQKGDDDICLRTNHNLLLALVEILVDLKPASILIGDAPIQLCNWEKIVLPDFNNRIHELAEKHNIPIIIKDFRRAIYNPSDKTGIKEKKAISDYVLFDLGTQSYLEPISSKKNIFRVTNYNPDRLAVSHTSGIHKYCIAKEFFDVDVVISLPKVKTHQKAGITCALKNLVGINGDKDFLPHHRVGGTGFGGDCYPGTNYFRRLSERCLDHANRNIGGLRYKVFVLLSSFFWRINKKSPYHHLAAGWYGNDTTWRMVLDLNHIAKYGKIDGTMSETPQREIYSLCDGIIGGQGDGPLHPEPLPLGILSFSNHSALTDNAMACLMGFDCKKIPLIKESIKHISINRAVINLNGRKVQLKELNQYKVRCKPPTGWEKHIENDG